MQSTRRLMYALAVIQLILPFCLQHSYYQPHRDEFLYLAEGHHMAWGFMEVPPLLSVFAWLTNAFGASMFWIKIWSVLFGVFTFLLTGYLVLSLGGKKFALFLCWLPLTLGGYLRLFFLFQPNFLDVFFWTSMAYGLIRYIQTGKNKWLYWFGISAGLGMMSKYSVAFYLSALLAGLLLTPQRKIFLNKHFYFASLLALLIFLPNLNWQYQHRWPVIFHMQELQDEQLKFNNYSDFIVSQLLMNLPFIYLWIAGLIFTGFRKNGSSFRFLAWAYLFVILLLMLLHGKDYYALGVYPVLFAFGGFALEELTEMRMRWLRVVLPTLTIALCLLVLPLTLPLAKPEQLATYYKRMHLAGKEGFIWEDRKPHPLPQDYGDMIGWRELALQTGAVYNNIPEADRENTVVYCRGYYTAGALNYYREQAHLPEVISDNASFLFWMPDTYHVKNLILVGRHLPQPDDKVFTQFAKITVKDSVNIPLFRENGMKIILCENPTDSVNSFIEISVATLKKQYTR